MHADHHAQCDKRDDQANSKTMRLHGSIFVAM
jgi:hypothetical protein